MMRQERDREGEGDRHRDKQRETEGERGGREIQIQRGKLTYCISRRNKDKTKLIKLWTNLGCIEEVDPEGVTYS